MKFKTLSAAASVLLGAALGGCYTYTPPPAVFEGNSFSSREVSQDTDLLANVTELTLSQAIDIAVANNHTYEGAYHAVNAARMRYYQAWGAYSPTVNASFSMYNSHSNYYHQVNVSQGDSSNFSTSTGVSASFLVFDGLAREMAIYAQKHNLQYQEQMREDIRRRLIMAVSYAYNDILMAIENKRIAVADMEFQQKNLSDTMIKYDLGAVSMSDVLNFQVKVNDSIKNQIAADYQYETALYSLAVLMGYPEGTLPARISFPAFDATIDDTLTGIEVYLDTALNNRPDLAAYREQLEIAKYNMYGTYSAFSPTVSVGASFGFNTSYTRYRDRQKTLTGNYQHTRFNNPSFNYGGEVNWVIFNGFRRYNAMREAQAMVASAEFSVAESWLTVVNEVRAAYANYVQNVKQAKVSELQLGLVVKQRELVEYEYKTGDTELTRLNEAQLALVNAETAFVNAKVSLLNAKAQLEAVTNTNFIGRSEPGELLSLDAGKEALQAVDQQILAPEAAVAAPPPRRQSN